MILKKTTLIFTITLGAAFNNAAHAKQITLDYEFQNPSGNGQFSGLISPEQSLNALGFVTPAVEFGGIRGDLTIAKTNLWFDVNPYPYGGGRLPPYDDAPTPQFVIGMDMSFGSYNGITSGQFYNGEVSPPSYYQAQIQLNFQFWSEDYPGKWDFYYETGTNKVWYPTPWIYQYHIQATADTPRFEYEWMASNGAGLVNGHGANSEPSWISQDLYTENRMSTKSQGLFINLSGYKPVTPYHDIAIQQSYSEVAIVPFTVPDPGIHNLPYPAEGPGAVSAQLVGTLRNYQIYSDPRATGNSFSNPTENTIVIGQSDNAYNNLEFTNDGVIDNEDVLTNWYSAKLLNRNVIQNNGQLINYGLLENNNSATVFNDDLLSNQENAQFIQHGGNFQNSAVATLENAGNTIFDQNAVLTNEGFIAQKGGQKFVLESGATMENSISGMLDNFGHMVVGNLSVIRNEGRYVGNGNSDLLIDHGEFDNYGLINLAGTPVLGVISPNILVVNNGSLSNASGKQITGSTGSIWLKDGGYFLNRGDVNIGSLSLSSTNTTRTTHFQNYFDSNFTGKVMLSGQGTEFENRGNTTLINESQMTNQSLLFLAANSSLKVNANASLLLASGAEIKGADRTNSRLENLGLLDIKSFINITGINLHNAATVHTSGVVELDKGVFENDSALVMDGNSLFIIGADQIMRVGSPDGAAGLVQGLDPQSKISNNGSLELLKGAYVSQGKFQQNGQFLLAKDFLFDGNFRQLSGFSDIQGKMLKEASVEGGVLVSTGAEFGNKLDITRTAGIPTSAVFWNSTSSSIAADMTVGPGANVLVQSGATVTVGKEVFDSGNVKIQGILEVGATNGGLFYVKQGGSLGGPGKIRLINQGKVFVEPFGQIAPGDPVTFTIDGDLEVNQGTLDIQIAGPGDHDVINVTGNTVFNGGTVKFNYMNDYFVAPSANPDVAWLTAGGNVTGVETLHQLFAYTQSSGQLHVIDPQYDYLIGVTGGVVNELPHYSNTAAIETRAGGVLSNQAGGMLFNDEKGVITNRDGGTLNNTDGAQLFNAGTLRNMDAGTTLNNRSLITNVGSIFNQVGASVNNDAGSQMVNYGVIENSGQLSNFENSDLVNQGTFKNNGNVFIAGNSSLEGEGSYVQEGGFTRLDGMLVQASSEILGGKIGGGGTVDGDLVVNAAGIDLGKSDTFTINGDLALTNGWLNFSMAGLEEHGMLNLIGHGSFSGGIVKIDFTNGYSPAADDFTTYLYAANGLDGIDTLQFQFTGLPNGMRLDFLQDANSLGWRAVGLASVPLPASAWLMASALAGLVCFGRTRKSMPA